MSGPKSSPSNPAEPVRVLCAANADYAAPLCVMLVSLVSNHAPGRKIEIYALATRIPEEDRRKIEASLLDNRPDFDPASLHWLSPDLDSLQGLFISEWANLEVYARLLAPRVLPEDFGKVLYLDCDMVVLSDLSPLYDMPCGDSAVLAVRDRVGYVSGPLGVFNYAELGIPPQTHYFNTGVLLMNLRRWREKDIAERVFDYLKRHHDSVHHWDQGGMNAVLHDAWTEIDPVWNQMGCVLHPDHWRKLGRPMSEWRKTLRHAKIVHYTGRDKPWLTEALPRYSHFFKYLARTRYRSLFKGRRREQILGFRLNFFIWRTSQSILRQKGRVPGPLRRLLKPLVSPLINLLDKH